MNPSSPLDNLLFLNLPEGMDLSAYKLQIKSNIPLPVQKPDNGDFDISQLTPEMIFAGILVVLAYDHHNQYLDDYRKLLLEAKPNIKQELTEAAILKSRNEDFDIAEEIFSALRGLDPEDMLITLNTAIFFDQRADSYRQSGLFEDADAYDDCAGRFYAQVMESDNAPPEVFFNAGFFFLKQKNFSRGKECFETYLALTCDISDEELGENGQYKRQRAQEIVMDISNRNLEDEQFKAAYDYILSEQEEKGLEEIRKFLKKNPRVWNAWFMLGWGLRRLQRWEEARDAFLQSIECGSTEPDTLNELAICYMELGEYTESKKCLVEALSLEPENTKYMSNLGYLALKQGNPQEARKFFLAVLEFDAQDKIALQMLEDLE
ncbi:MAG: tetratricopeptide repeat protein [Spirochaetaceae bacterium]|nr:tetratricopeptide repeat protein [Spirochaetaceae bacterium]